MLNVAHKPFKNTANMSDSSKWKKRLPGRIYDYNYKVSEGYYHPQTTYLENRNLNRSSAVEPPKHQTYAERFASKPWYGERSGLPYDDARSALAEPIVKLSRNRGSSLVREIRDNDQENIPLHIRASRRRKKIEEEERELGVRPTLTKQTSLTERPTFSKLNDMRKEINQIHDDMLRKIDLTKDPGTSAFKSTYASSTSNSRPPVSSTTKSTRTTYTESSLNKPRHTFTDSVFSPWPRRRASVSGDASLPVSFNRADRFREMKRTEEKRDMAKDVTGLVDKIRAGGSRIDSDIAFNFASNLRSSSLEPLSRRGSRKGRLVYGVAKSDVQS